MSGPQPTVFDCNVYVQAMLSVHGASLGLEILDAAKRLGGQAPLGQVIVKGLGLRATA